MSTTGRCSWATSMRPSTISRSRRGRNQRWSGSSKVSKRTSSSSTASPMSETSDHAARLLRAYQAQEKRFVERRFPLQFAPEVPAIRELYSQAKGLRWNPETDIPWERFDAERYTKTTREAARRTWSRRAWSVYPGLTERTALLIRFCLESGSLGMDAKLFLSFRPSEEAKHLEVCHLLAERLGGYEPDPGEAGAARARHHPVPPPALRPPLPAQAVVRPPRSLLGPLH